MMDMNTQRRVRLILKLVGKCSLTGDTRVHPYFVLFPNWSGAKEKMIFKKEAEKMHPLC